MYENLIQSSTIEELKHKILKNIIILYIRVRSFSLAKDVVNKHKKEKERNDIQGKGTAKEATKINCLYSLSVINRY